MFSGRFSRNKFSKVQSLVVRWACKHQILAYEVKDFAKVKLLNVNRTDVYLYDVKVSEDDVLEAR